MVSKRSLWLLEGFTGYLEKEELDRIMYAISMISQLDSLIVATFIGVQQNFGFSFHRFRTDGNDPGILNYSLIVFF